MHSLFILLYSIWSLQMLLTVLQSSQMIKVAIAPLFIVSICTLFREFTTALWHILLIHNVMIKSCDLTMNFHQAFTLFYNILYPNFRNIFLENMWQNKFTFTRIFYGHCHFKKLSYIKYSSNSSKVCSTLGEGAYTKGEYQLIRVNINESITVNVKKESIALDVVSLLSGYILYFNFCQVSKNIWN